jgi:glucose-6-phosphate dehydrogenase assembly protein OpcA
MSNLESELLGLLAAHATRIIVDSGALTDSFKEFARLIALRQRYPSAAISDLAWARLTPWRQLTAQFFDGPMLSELQNLTHLSIGYVSDPKLESTAPAEALLLAGWLVKQLRCATGISQQTPTVVKRQNLLIWHFDRPGGSFRVQVRPEAEVGIGITSLKLACSDLQPCARFLISRGEKNLTAITELPRREPVRRVVRHGPHATGDAVCRELEILGHDNLYERVLEISAELGSTAA